MSAGIVERRAFITRQMLRDEPDVLFVFGDNMVGRGLGGQAAEMRGEPNAVGIPTKVAPHRGAEAFFSDEDWPSFKLAITDPFQRLAEHLRLGGRVVWPDAGIGTGLADLERRAPRLWACLERYRERLFALAPTPTDAGETKT